MFYKRTKIAVKQFLTICLLILCEFMSPLCEAQEAIELIKQADTLRVTDRQSSLALLKKASHLPLSSYEQDYFDYLNTFHVAMSGDIAGAARQMEPLLSRHASGRLALRLHATLLSLYAGTKEWEKGVILVNELAAIQKNTPRDSDWYTARVGQVFFFLHLQLFDDALQLILDARSYPEAMSEELSCRFTTYEFVSLKGLSPNRIGGNWLEKLQNACDHLPPNVYTTEYIVSWAALLNEREDYHSTVNFVESHRGKVRQLNYYHLFAELQEFYAKALFELERYQQAEAIVNELVNNPLSKAFLQGYLNASMLKSDLALKRHNFAESYHWLRVASELRRQEQKSALTKRLAIAQAEFSLAASERALEALSKQNALLERELSVNQQRMLNSSLIVVLSITLTLLTLASLVRHRLQRKDLIRSANTDALTGLANRRRFMEAVSSHLKNTESNETGSLILFDLDNLKWVNDGFGHQNGDWVLQQVSQCISTLESPSVLSAARIGGEEFAIFLRDMSANQAQKFAAQLQQHFQVIDTNERLDSWRISASFGICDTQTAGVQLSELLNAADMALYQAKKAGKQQAVIYQPANNTVT